MSAKRPITSSSKKTPPQDTVQVKKNFAAVLSSPDDALLTPIRRSGRQAERKSGIAALDEKEAESARVTKQKASDDQHDEATPAKKGRTETPAKLPNKPQTIKLTPGSGPRKTTVPLRKPKSLKKKLIVKLDRASPKSQQYKSKIFTAAVDRSGGDASRKLPQLLSKAQTRESTVKEDVTVAAESKAKVTKVISSSKVTISPQPIVTPTIIRTTPAKVGSVEVIRVSPTKSGTSKVEIVRPSPGGVLPARSLLIPAKKPAPTAMVTVLSAQPQFVKSKIGESPKTFTKAAEPLKAANLVAKAPQETAPSDAVHVVAEIQEKERATPTLRQSSRTKLLKGTPSPKTPTKPSPEAGKATDVTAADDAQLEETPKVSSTREPSARLAKKKLSESDVATSALSQSQIDAAVASISSDEGMDSPPVLRRKRVASELLKAAEIAHGMLDEGGSELNPETGQFVPKPTRVSPRRGRPSKNAAGGAGSEEWVSILRSPGDKHDDSGKVSVGLTADLDSDVETDTKPAVARQNGHSSQPASRPGPAKPSGFNMATEKSHDKIFDGVTAIIKSSLIDNDQARDFVLNRLPALTGVSAVVSPSHHFLLHGSWKSIIRARESLDRYLSALAALTSESQKLLKMTSNKKSNQSQDADFGIVEVLGAKKDRHLPVDPEISAHVASQVQIGSDWQDTDDAFDDEIDMDNSGDLDWTPKGSPAEVRKGGRTRGFDQSKLSSNVEVYKDTSEGTTYLCSMCGYSSNQKYNVTAHIQKKHSERKFKCLLCSKAFAYEAELERHMRTTHISGEKFTCNICDKQFSDKRYLSTHLKRHSGVRKHQCPVCDRKFFERHKLRWHLETHKEASEKNLPYSCSVCHRKFYNRSSLADHQNIHTGARPFECQMCEASFSHRIGLKRHLLVHSDDRPFPCPDCGKAFKTKKQLETHTIQHTGKSKNVCGGCDRPFATLNSLKRHLLICTKDEGRDASSVITEQVLVQDPEGLVETSAAGIDGDLDEQTIYMCGVCDAVFPTLEEAATHTRTHTTDVQLQYQNAADDAGESYIFAVSDSSLPAPSEVNPSSVIANTDGVADSGETAVKLLNAMTSGVDCIIHGGAPTSPMDDTHIVANTLADLSALGQSQI